MARKDVNRWRVESAEVLYASADLAAIGRSHIDALERRSASNPRRRIRLCAHNSPADQLHEMLIVHERGAYVRPHKHPGKSESMHVIKGEADYVVFDDSGVVGDVIRLGDFASGHTFFCRTLASHFHTLIIRTEIFVFHETTNGPFVRGATVFAPWAPEDSTVSDVEAFVARLDYTLEEYR